jgi:dTDP-glucose 4,6-dehydratase
MQRQRAVVTGGAGFLGSHLAERLVEGGFEVLCLDSFLTGSRENLDGLLDRPSFRLVETDVCDGLSVRGPVDAVLHLASPASPVDYLRYPVETMRVGALGTLHALELARQKGARFVLASTSETYGDPLVHPQPETYWGNVNPVGPRSVYDEAKRFAEALTMAYRRTHRVDTGIMRIFNTYGPRMRADDGRVVPTFVMQALRGDPLTVAGDGLQTRSLCYVDDLVEGVMRMLASPHPGPVNLGNPEELTVLELAGLVRDLTASGSGLTFVPLPADDPALRRPDIRLARAVLGWEPKVCVQEGLLRTIAWFRDHQLPADASWVSREPGPVTV